MRVEIIETDEGVHLCESCRFVNIVCDFGYKEINRKGKTIVCEGFYMRASLQDLEAERQEALKKPDKKKILEWVARLDAYGPKVESIEAKKIVESAEHMLTQLYNFIITEVKKL